MKSAEFPNDYRLGKPADFEHVFEKPYKSSDAYLTLLARKGTGDCARLGLAISKKNVRKAVNRNLIKRQARESFRLRHNSLGKLDIIVMARQAAKQADKKTIRQSLEKHWDTLIKKCNLY